jgi:hypothetical protein
VSASDLIRTLEVMRGTGAAGDAFAQMFNAPRIGRPASMAEVFKHTAPHVGVATGGHPDPGGLGQHLPPGAPGAANGTNPDHQA